MYQVLARKYRPRNFIELVGQNHVSRALTSALERGRLHHAYLFTGTRGVGKTTIARILAKCLNCETGVTSTPCEVCATCKAVNEGRFIDLIEIDAASRTKVEDTRELLDNVPYAPTQGRFKVYLIDEVHMLSTHSFNALLKTLEEPPEHVKFLFATTDPQKLPITVISRCLQFTLRPLAVDEITTHLTDILQKEQIQAEQDAIWQIAESAQGSLRDALSLTDQAIAYGQGSIQHQDVKDMLGLIDRTIIYDLIGAIHQNQQGHISQLLMQFRQQALDVSLVLDQLISTLHELALLQYLPELSLKYSAEINAKIMQLSQSVSAQDLQLYYQVACKGRADLQLAVTQEQGFEMCVLRLLAFRPMQPNERLVSAQPAGSDLHHGASQPALDTQAAAAQSNMDLPNSTPTNASQPAVLPAMQPEPVPQNRQQTVPAEPSAASNAAYDDGYYADEDEDSYAPAVSDEPSSDDFLDDESEDSAAQPSTETVTSPETSHHYSVKEPEDQQHSASSSAVQPSVIQVSDQQIVFDAGNDSALFDLDAPAHAEPEPEVDVSIFDVIAPLDDIALQISDQASERPAVKQAVSPTEDQSASMQTAAAVQEAVMPSVSASAALNEPQAASNQPGLMPQDILKLQPQTLEGEWTVDKWEYWFRSSQLSPALQELAQHGLMQGSIDGESIFHIPQQYERLVTQMQHLLEQALQAQWPATRFAVKYEDLEQLTPYALQHERKDRAYQRAAELLHEEPVVKSLMTAFDGKLENIKLK